MAPNAKIEIGRKDHKNGQNVDMILMYHCGCIRLIIRLTTSLSSLRHAECPFSIKH